MNIAGLNALADTILAAQKNDRTPMGIAFAIASAGQHLTSELKAELERLRLLQNAQPAELSEEQLEALIDAGNEALNDYYHERACSCSEWPQGCSTNPSYTNGYWDTEAFAIGAAAVVGAWESMRAPAETERAARHRNELRVRRNEDMALRTELAPMGAPRAVPFELGESLVPAVQWLIARVAERGAQASRLVEENKRLRARVAELETSARGCDGEGCVLPHSSWCTRAREFAAQHNGCTCGEPWKDTPQTHAGHCWLLSPPWDEMEWHRKRVADLLARVAELEGAKSRPAPVLAPSVQPDARRDASVGKLQNLLAGQRAAIEDPHDSELHHPYRLGRDLPEMPRG